MARQRNEIIQFHKMVASGNDFVVVDNRSKVIQDAGKFARLVCPAHTGVGADGVLLVEESSKSVFKMRIINSDGSEAEACGNGFRCMALYGYRELGLPKRFKFESLAGMIDADVISDKRVRVGLVNPKGLCLRKTLEVSGNRLHVSFINTGVPHVVVLTQGLEKVDVNKLGSLIRYHEAFKPAGTNVNFAEIQGIHDVRVRTYERGVESETLACGTGSTASAIIAALSGYVKPPVRVKTRSGEILGIDFKKGKQGIRQVTLEGDVRFVFEGVLAK